MRVFIAFFALALLSACVRAPSEVHDHADFIVMINGVPYNFSQERYMSVENDSLSPFMHLHDMNGLVIHKHLEGVVLPAFFQSINWTLNSSCIETDSGQSYCNDGVDSLKLIVNGNLKDDFLKYSPADLDRILISYGPEKASDLGPQFALVSNDSCIYSLKCPERGSPPDENDCAGEVCPA